MIERENVNIENNANIRLSQRYLDRSIQRIVNNYDIQSVFLQELYGNRYLITHNIYQPPASPASTIKIIVARVLQSKIIQGELSLNTQIQIRSDLIADGENRSVGSYVYVSELLRSMLQSSSNTSANHLIKKMGGLQRVTSLARNLGYSSVTFRNYFSIDVQSSLPNVCNVRDANQAMKDLWLRNDGLSNIAKDALRNADKKFGYRGEIAAKIGNNSKVLGDIGILRIGNGYYVVGIYLNRGDSSRSRQLLSAAMGDIITLIKN